MNPTFSSSSSSQAATPGKTDTVVTSLPLTQPPTQTSQRDPLASGDPLATALPTTTPTVLQPTPSRRPEAPRSTAQETNIKNPETRLEQKATGQAAEQEPEKERELNIERLEAQIQEAKVRGPQKVAVARDTIPASAPKTVAQPVVVLPLTETEMEAAEKKPMQFSVKWLWGWCRRQIRKFKEILVVYRDEPKTDVSPNRSQTSQNEMKKSDNS